MIVILGAGLAGLSVSYHAGREQCVLLEAKDHAFGHVASVMEGGYTWDEGPHVSFTKHQYVRDLFAQSVGQAFCEYEVLVGNYYQGAWIDHPAQSNLYQVPEPLRGACVEAFLKSRGADADGANPENYAEWLTNAFGAVFAEEFAAQYTRKYWTAEPEVLSVDWVGSRVFRPAVSDVLEGAVGPLPKKTHYITKVRYPRSGGYQGFGKLLAQDANILYGRKVERVNLAEQTVECNTGEVFPYTTLVSTMPLPEFVRRCGEVPDEVAAAASQLCCTQLLLLSFEVPHPAQRPENWLYVYDRDMLTTRVHFTERMSDQNAPEGCTGIQVEVYFSKYKAMDCSIEEMRQRVLQELVQMGLILQEAVPKVRVSTKWVEWANVLFDHNQRGALDTIFEWMTRYGLEREPDDLHPLSDWSIEERPVAGKAKLILAGRFGQWKYYWSDDCVLRGQALAAGVRSGRFQ
ncbi:protoporphyrinogen/coproporphyrinogen oxidase [Paludibaculum fermentans]|uniref:FAD-dependent oxidoreductase n=1 Tax=Paludibaculum fermentans TaxID=1473598 RepID=A0A7S7NK53_PALFE|nr:FAD-dependent oxidoreductase [Paludibaculum fermentans]QOY85100.1 FAD-dependent oxidoreductase [Paludibaculum fermentans]